MNNNLKSNLKVLLVGLVLMLIFQNCSNTEADLASVNLEMKATTSLSTLNPSGRIANADLVFTEIMLGVTEIEFETLEENNHESNDDFDDEDDDGEDDDEEIEFEGNFIVDLIAGTSTPDFGIADVVPGIYEEIEIELGAILDDGNSLFIAFDFTPDGATEAVRYEFSTNAELKFEIEHDDGFLIDQGAVNQMLILIDLDLLFAELDLNSAVADVDGVVRINPNSNTDLAYQLAQNLYEAMDGGEDEDGDGEFDD